MTSDEAEIFSFGLYSHVKTAMKNACREPGMSLLLPK